MQKGTYQDNPFLKAFDEVVARGVCTALAPAATTAERVVEQAFDRV